MKVRATKTGYYPERLEINGVVELDYMRRREGDVFELFPYEIQVVDVQTQRKTARRLLTPDEQFSENWMEKADVTEETHRPTSAKEALARVNNELLEQQRGMVRARIKASKAEK